MPPLHRTIRSFHITTNIATASQNNTGYSSGITYERLQVEYDIRADGTYTKTLDSVRRIDTDAGVQKESTYSIHYKDGAEDVQISHAYVVNAAGRRADVSQDAILHQLPKANPETSTFTDVHSIAVVFPNVRPGARLYLKYRLTRLRPDFAGVFSVIDWYSVHARRLDYQYTFRAPAALGLNVQATDMVLDKTREGDVEIWRARGAVPDPIAPERGSIAAINYSPRLMRLRESAAEHNLQQSMSRRGNCHDNAVAESFFQLLKRERIRRKTYGTRDQARQDVFDYIEMFYNPKRRHSFSNDMSPVEYEKQYFQRLSSV
jgi:hypothetical protein